MNFEQVSFAVENHWVCSTLDLSESFNKSNMAVWTRRIYSGNGNGATKPTGCGGYTTVFPARDDLKIFDGCADDLLAELSK